MGRGGDREAQSVHSLHLIAFSLEHDNNRYDDPYRDTEYRILEISLTSPRQASKPLCYNLSTIPALLSLAGPRYSSEREVEFLL